MDQLPNGDYSLANFYTNYSRDKRGFSTTARVSLAPDIKRLIDEIVASRQIAEVRTGQDFIRDCIIHRLKWLEQNNEALSEQITAALRLNHSQNRLAQFKIEEQLVEARLEELAVASTSPEIQEVLDQMESDFSTLKWDVHRRHVGEMLRRNGRLGAVS